MFAFSQSFSSLPLLDDCNASVSHWNNVKPKAGCGSQHAFICVLVQLQTNGQHCPIALLVVKHLQVPLIQ